MHAIGLCLLLQSHLRLGDASPHLSPEIKEAVPVRDSSGSFPTGQAAESLLAGRSLQH